MSSTNWAGNFTYSAGELRRPRSVEQAAELVAGSSEVHVLGSRHSFNDVADTGGLLLTVADLPAITEVAPDRRTVRTSAGTRYGDLALALEGEGLALEAMASLPHISVAGAIATATHGSGDTIGNLATAVSGLELIRSDGELVALSREHDPDLLRGAVVGLGALGAVTTVVLDVVPSYRMRQDVYEGLSWTALVENFDAITSSAQSTSFFTRWGEGAVAQVWLKSVVGSGDAAPAPEQMFGARLAAVDRHPLPGQSAATCTPQGGVPGPWFERLPHFRLDFTPSAGEEVQAEYLVERAALGSAIGGIRALAPQLDPLLIMSELRTVAADNLWLSPAHGRDVVAFHFTFVRDQPRVEALLPAIEEVLMPLGARPHWAKLFTPQAARELAQRYPRWGDFVDLRARFDPRGAFVNAYLRRVGLADG